MIIRSVLSGEIDKAEKKISAGKVTNNLDAIDATDVTSGKYSLMGEMTDADGKAYERFLREGPQEGLTQTEIIGISKADAQTALNTKCKYAVTGKGIEGGGDVDIPNTKSSINQGKDPFKNAYFKKPDKW